MSKLEGTFIARVTDNSLGYTKEEKPFIYLNFVIEEGASNGQMVPWYGYFTEKTQERTMQALRTCGWKGDDLSNLEGVCDNLVQIVVSIETYNDRERSRVQWINPLGIGVVRGAMSDEQKKEFAKKMKGLAIKSLQDAQSVHTADTDDIPF